jgi:hypothetical protein
VIPEVFNIAICAMLQSPWREVARLYRQACWHSSQSRDAEAQRILQGDFAEALARANAIAPFSSEQLQAALETEADRVANALAVFELIGGGAFMSLVSASSQGAARFDPFGSLVQERPSSGDVPGIADLIEEMLLQDRHPRGTNGS